MLIFAPSKTEALVVQWIERRFPKPLIWVRFPVRVQSLSYKEVIGSYKEVKLASREKLMDKCFSYIMLIIIIMSDNFIMFYNFIRRRWINSFFTFDIFFDNLFVL